MSHRPTALFIISTLLLGAGCNMSAPTSPLFGVVPGRAPTVYAGSVVDSIKGTGTLVVSLSSGGGLTGGTWLMTFGGKVDGESLVSGTVNGTTYTAMVTECAQTDVSGCTPNCALSFTGSLTATAIDGAYTAVQRSSCPARAGTVDARR